MRGRAHDYEFFNDTPTGKLRRIVFDLWKQHFVEKMLPTNIRFLFYELIGQHILSKADKYIERNGETVKRRRTDSQILTDVLTELRVRELIPWSDIIDETRDVDLPWHPLTIADGMHNAWRYTEIDLWEGTAAPIIICESRSLRGALALLAAEFQMPITSTNGQTQGHLRNFVAPAFFHGDPDDRVIRRGIYFGDNDKGGGDIEVNTRTVLEKVIGCEITWDRIAVTDEQAARKGIVAIQKFDKRSQRNYPAVECEALGQKEIVRLLRAEFNRLRPPKVLAAVRARQEREREALRRKLGYQKEVRP
jgi:hypothetical protein